MEDLYSRCGSVGTGEFGGPIGLVFDCVTGEAPDSGPQRSVGGAPLFGPPTYERSVFLEFMGLTCVSRWWQRAVQEWGEGP